MAPYLNIIVELFIVHYQGKFRLKNPNKYKGDPTNVVYRSSWEHNFMVYCDTTKEVKWWSSEEKAIWYPNPVTKKQARYFPDFIVCYQRTDGTEVVEMVEIKPQAQVDGPPRNPKRKTQAWVNAVKTYLINHNKWEAATKVCEDKGWNFRLLTEKNVPQWGDKVTKPPTKRRRRRNK